MEKVTSTMMPAAMGSKARPCRTQEIQTIAAPASERYAELYTRG